MYNMVVIKQRVRATTHTQPEHLTFYHPTSSEMNPKRKRASKSFIRVKKENAEKIDLFSKQRQSDV